MPLFKSLGLHLVILACLVLSISFTAEPLPMPAQSAPVIQATFIDAQAIADKKRAEAQALAAEQEKQRKAEAKRKREREAAAKREREKKARQEAEKKRKQELERKAAEEARKKREREEAKKREAERKKREAEEQAQLEQLMQEQLEAERAAQQVRRSRQVLTEVEKYQALIQQTIMRYLIEDSDFEGKRCRLRIRLASTGLVSEVTIRDGDQALCRAARSAVLRPDKLPVSSEPDVYEKLKNINLTVEL